MKRRRLLFLVLMIVANVGGLLSRAAVAAPPETGQLSGKVLIMAAASTTDAVEQIRADFLRLHPSVTIRVSYAASSTLAQPDRCRCRGRLVSFGKHRVVGFPGEKETDRQRTESLVE